MSVYVCVERENVRHFLREILPVIKSNMLVTFGDLFTSVIRVKLQREGREPEAAAEVLSLGTRIKVGDVTHKTSELHRRTLRAGYAAVACSL